MLHKLYLLVIFLLLISLPVYAGELSNGFEYTKDSSGNLLLNRFDFNYSNNILELESSYSYGQRDNVKDEEKVSLSLTNIVPLSDRFSFRITDSFFYDYSSKLDRRVSIIPHLSYSFLNGKVFSGLDYSFYKYKYRDMYDAYNLYFGEEFSYNISEDILFTHHINYFPEIKDLSRYKVDSSNKISFFIREDFNLNINYLYNYDSNGYNSKSLLSGITYIF